MSSGSDGGHSHDHDHGSENGLFGGPGSTVKILFIFLAPFEGLIAALIPPLLASPRALRALQAGWRRISCCSVGCCGRGSDGRRGQEP